MSSNIKRSPIPPSFIQRMLKKAIDARKEKMTKGSFINRRRQQAKDHKYRMNLRKFRESTKHLTSPSTYCKRMNLKVYPSDYIDKSLITECPKSPGLYWTPHSPSCYDECVNPWNYKRSNEPNAFSVKINTIFAQTKPDGSYYYTPCTIIPK